ncbi:MAG: hypothetical protein ABI789_00595 [Usitatibacter sp.]
MTKPILAALAASFLVAGCAVDTANESGERRAEPQYRTGSNIATKRHDGPDGGPTTISREEIERSRIGLPAGGAIPKGN